eukprot:423973-Alexandrium_andersonii.AAC.1
MVERLLGLEKCRAAAPDEAGVAAVEAPVLAPVGARILAAPVVPSEAVVPVLPELVVLGRLGLALSLALPEVVH